MVADLDEHLEFAGILADLSRADAPERLEVVIYLVPEVLNDDGVVCRGKLVPLVEAWWGVSTPAFTVGGGGGCEGLRRLGKLGRELGLAGTDQGVDGVPVGALLPPP
jgi:hypothetical protein